MKNILILVFFVVLSFSAYATDNVGRYQLFHGYYYVGGVNYDGKPSENIKHDALLKIDTVSGKVWEYHVFITEIKSPDDSLSFQEKREWIPLN